jgi:hypothetical protein
MAQAVKSDGSVQKFIGSLLANFDTQTDEDLIKADHWLKGLKENGKERADDLTLHLLRGYGYKMYERFGKVSPFVNHYTAIKLAQGKSSWGVAYQAERGGTVPSGNTELQFPWN